MKAVLTLLLGLCLTSTFAGGIVSTLDHTSLETAIRGGGLVQITTSGRILLTNKITINAATRIEATVSNVVIDGGGVHSAFHIQGTSVHLENLAISNCVNAAGGAIFASQSTLTLLRCSLLNNRAISSPRAEGGAIMADRSHLFITNTFFKSNSVLLSDPNFGTASAGGAIYLRTSELNGTGLIFEQNTGGSVPGFGNGLSTGGAIEVENSHVSLVRSAFYANALGRYATKGGALNINAGSSVRLEICILAKNYANSIANRHLAESGAGGAIASSGTLSLLDCFLSENKVESSTRALGGAIYNEGTMELARCTFSKNIAQGARQRIVRAVSHRAGDGEGGAIFNKGVTTHILNCTFDANTAEGGAAYNAPYMGGYPAPLPGRGIGGAVLAATSTSIEHATFHSNLVWDGFVENSTQFPATNGHAIALVDANVAISNSIIFGLSNQIQTFGTNTLFDLGGNISSDTSFPFSGGTNSQLQLGQLGYYGGYTPTIPLLPNSPAINIGPIAQTNSIDQRHYLRPANERVDAGAYEFYPWGTDASTLPTNTFSVATSHHDSTGEVNFTQGTVATGALLFLEASPGNNSGFLGWSGSVTSMSPQLFLIVTQDLQLTASFAILRNITISNSNPSAGHTSLTNATYPEGETVSVSATPNRGSRFVRWTGTYNNTNNPLTFTLEANTQLTAIFEQAPSYSVAANSNGSGTVNPSSTNVFEGETLTLQATPSPNNRFTGWTGSFNSTQNPLVIKVTSNINLTANFQPTLFRLHFHDNTGLFAHWEGTLEEITHAQLDWPLGEPNRMPTYWQLASASDRFKRWDNGEAYLDLIWRGQQGEVAYWQVNNKSLQMASGQIISGPANLGSWILSAGPYFDSANAFGLLWLHPPTGHLGTWFGTNQQAQVFLPPNSGWELIKARDFNADGNADILWQHTDTGAVGFWNGTKPFTSLDSSMASMASVITGPVPGWRVVDLVDLDADGALDLLWQSKSTGAVAVWLLDGLQLRTTGNAAFIIPKNGPAFYHNPGPHWRIFAVKTSY